jgi:hypothetical protein
MYAQEVPALVQLGCELKRVVSLEASLCVPLHGETESERPSKAMGAQAEEDQTGSTCGASHWFAYLRVKAGAIPAVCK